MAKQFNITYTNFLGGLNNRKAPHLLEANEGQIVKNVDLRDGMLRPLRDLGTTTKTFSGLSRNYKWIWYAAGSRWLGADQYRYALNDGAKTYFTVPGSAPRIHETAGSSYFQEHRMGVTPPTTINWSLGGGGVFLKGSYTYAVTYETYDGLESNPPGYPLNLRFDTYDSWGVDLTIYASLDKRVIRANIYRSELNGAVLYYAGSVEAKNFGTANNFVDRTIPDTALDKLRPLTWGTGGSNITGSAISSDHGVPPVLSILSNTLHSINDSTGVSGSGILFGAVGSTVRWSALGYPEYWPEVNFFNAGENVESIISWAGSTYIFTSNQVYIASGYSDDEISIKKSLASIGIYPGMGHLTKLTPKGVMYLSREGLTIFDSANSVVISSGKLSRSFLDPTQKTFQAAAYYQDKYYLFCESSGVGETIIADFKDGLENLRFSTTTHNIKTAVTANFTEPAYAEKVAPLPGLLGNLYVVTPGIYTTFPQITFSDTSLTIKANVSIDNVIIGVAGSGYTTTPSVSVSGACTRPASLQAVLVNDKVSSITILDPGEGYTVMPTVTIAAPPSGVTATVSSVYVRLTGAAKYSTLQLTEGASVASPPNFKHQLDPISSSTVNDVYNFSMLSNPSTAKVDTIIDYLGAFQEAITAFNLNFASSAFYQLILKPNITTAPTATVTGSTPVTGTGGTVVVDVESVGCRKLGLTILSNKIYKFGGEIEVRPSIGSLSTSFVHSYNQNTSQWSSENVSIPITGNNGYTGAVASQPAVTVGTFAYTPTLQWSSDPSSNTRKLFAFSTGSSGTTSVDVPNTYVALATDGTDIYMGSYTGSNSLRKITPDGTSTSVVTNIRTAGWTTHGFSLVATTAANGGTDKLYLIGGQDISDVYDSNIYIINKTTAAITTDNFGMDFGFTARSYHVSAVVDNRYIVIHGGESKDVNGNLIYLSDLHIYDTQAALGSGWVKKFDTIASIGDRSKHAMTLVDQDLYIVGGSNSDSLYTDDVYRLPVDQLLDYNLTPNLYVAEGLSSGNVNVKPFESGSAMSTWQWRGREEMAPDNGPFLSWMRARVYGLGGMTWKVLTNGSVPSPQFSKAFAAIATTVQRFWFPSDKRARGQRLTLDITQGSATPTNNDNITRIEIEAKQDGEL
jgi:hypothetical protein